MNMVMGASDGYDYYSTSEYLSLDPAFPTHFENVIDTSTPRGMMIDGIGPSPMDVSCKAITLVSGILTDNWFSGIFQITCEYHFENVPMFLRSQFPSRASSHGSGTFKVELLPNF